jgi:hypothetical protein
VTFSSEVLVTPFISAALMGVIAWVAMRVEGAKTRQRLDDKEKADKEAADLRQQLEQNRHDEYCRRLDRIEKKTGITNGGGEYIARELFDELRLKVCEGIREGKEAIRSGHEDREAIKRRIDKVEYTLEALVKKGVA